MGLFADGLLAAAGVFGVACCVLGYDVGRREAPGATAFGWFLAAWGATSLVALLVEFLLPISAPVSVVVWCLATVPWFLFTLRYTGTEFGRRTVIAAALPVVALVPFEVAAELDVESVVVETLAVFVFLYYTALALVGAVVVLQASARYGHISIRQGIAVAAVGVVPPVTMNAFGVLSSALSEPATNALFLSGFAGVFAAAGVSVRRCGMFDATPAPGALGDRTLADVTEDLVVVTDREERVVTLNPAAERALGHPSLPAGDLRETLGVGLVELRDSETVEVRTPSGTRTFDPAVTPLSDQHDEQLGYLVALHDVTDREIRRQRLEVLNRIMRHNVRNRTTVVTGNAEWVKQQVDDEELTDRLGSATGAAESLAALSHKTKRIESILSREGDTTTTFEAAGTAQRAVPRGLDAQTTVRAPDRRVRGDEELLAFVVEMLTQHAADRGDQPEIEVQVTVEAGPYPVTVTVETDGPGVSREEIDVIRSGTEDPLRHASGIDLWVTNWAVTDAGGELSFADDGREIRVALPFQPASASPEQPQAAADGGRDDER